MGSHINREELEQLAHKMDRDVLIKIIQIGFGILISKHYLYVFFC
tara:strand:- start:1102 stop:1236 length:135 start_codon:yes stop_codon:yes gene_type:complete